MILSQKDHLDLLLMRQELSMLSFDDAKILEMLQMLQMNNMLDIDLSAQDHPVDFTYTGNNESVASDSPPLDHYPNMVSYLAHNGGQNTSASSAALDNSLSNHHHHRPSYRVGANNQSNLASSSPFGETSTPNHYTTQPEQQRPAGNILGASPFPVADVAHAHAQGPASIATPGLPRANDTCSAGAAVPLPCANGALPPPGINGLRFHSFATASAAADLIFRKPVDAVSDDIDEVVNDKYRYVALLVEALKHDDHRPPPEEWRGNRNKIVARTQKEKADFVAWQERSREAVRSWLKMPNIGVKLESVAWEIFEEILKVRLAGAKLSKKPTSKSKTCSDLIQEAIGALRDWANVRLKAINSYKIPAFAANPTRYAHDTYTFFRNNSGRLPVKHDGEMVDGEAGGFDEIGDAEKTGEGVATGKATKAVKKAGATGTSAKQGNRGPSENGAIAHQFMSAVEVRKRKRKDELDAEVPKRKTKVFKDAGASVNRQQQQNNVETTHSMPTLAAAFDAAVPGARPTQPFPTQGGMPGGNPNKKQRRI